MDSSHANQEKEVFIDPDSSLPKTYFELIEKVGSAGKYQTRLFYIFVLVFFVNGSILLSSSFMFMNDRYACQELGLLTTACKKTICEIQLPDQRNQYFIKNTEDVESVATDYGPFMCEDEFYLDLLRSCPYFGSFLGYILFSYISDNFGRRTTMSMSLGVATLGTILISTGFNLGMVAVGVILGGAGINVSAGMVFYFLGETVQNTKRQKYSILVQGAYTVGAIALTGLYFLIGKWRIVSILLQTLPAVITLACFLMYVEETPQFLLKGQNEKALKALNRIGSINFGMKGILSDQDLENVRFEQLANQSMSKTKVSPLDLFRFSSLRSTTIISCLLSYIILSMYYGPTLIIDSIGFNTYISSFAIQISEIIGFIPTYFYIDKAKRRATGLILFLIATASSLILTIVEKPEDCKMCPESIVQVVVIFFFRFSIAIEFALFLVYTVELFPARIVGLGNGAVSAVGTIASTLSPLILGYLKRMEFNLMMFFLILGIIGCALTLLLEETHGKPLKVEIEEIQYAKNKRKSEYKSDSKIHFLNSQKIL